MERLRSPWVLGAIAIAATAAVLHRVLAGHATGRHVEGGILIGDARAYDRHSRWLLGSLFHGIERDIIASAPPDARVLEVGSGPGHLSIRLARHAAFEVTGLDLDPAMINQARANAAHDLPGGRAPTFVVGDVAELPFRDDSFDLVVSTFSMHHWSDPTAGLNEIARVVQPDGRVLIWDLGAGFRLFHAHAPDPEAPVQNSALRTVSVRSWGWPWRLRLTRRLELVRR